MQVVKLHLAQVCVLPAILTHRGLLFIIQPILPGMDTGAAGMHSHSLQMHSFSKFMALERFKHITMSTINTYDMTKWEKTRIEMGRRPSYIMKTTSMVALRSLFP